MASTECAAMNAVVPNETDTPFSALISRPPSRRTSFLSSSSSIRSFSSSSQSNSSSNFGSMSFLDEIDSPMIRPTTPFRFFGIPFSWEQFPGIPKKLQQNPNKKDPSALINLLPLPPSGNSIPSTKFNRKLTSLMQKKHTASDSFRKDPFFAALMECSKDDEHTFRKSSRTTFSDRFGFVTCKTTCSVSESIVNIPRSRTHYF